MHLLKKLINVSSGVILETEGSVREIQKRALFHYKKVMASLCSLKKKTSHLGQCPEVRLSFSLK